MTQIIPFWHHRIIWRQIWL